MFADGLLPLVEAGVVNGARKKIDRGKIVASFLMGSRRVFEFADRNRMVRMREVAYTNDPFRIARNPKVVAINSAILIDLTGQVCADSLGTRMYSGVAASSTSSTAPRVRRAASRSSPCRRGRRRESARSFPCWTPERGW